jgi:hypothetical protein
MVRRAVAREVWARKQAAQMYSAFDRRIGLLVIMSCASVGHRDQDDVGDGIDDERLTRDHCVCRRSLQVSSQSVFFTYFLLVLNNLSRNFAFGDHDAEDIK